MCRARRNLGRLRAILPFCLCLAGVPDGRAELIEDARIDGSFDYWYRNRERAGYDPVTRQDTPKQANIRQLSGHLALRMASGWSAQGLGFDLGAYATWDSMNQAFPDHEMNFWNVHNPYDLRPRDTRCGNSVWDSTCTRGGAQVSTAALRYRNDDLTLRAGLIQPQAPGALGVNWSFSPGTYRGAEIAYRLGNWDLGALWADEYRAPWYQESYGFYRTILDQQGNARYGAAGNLTSLGAKTQLAAGLELDLGHSFLSEGPRKTAHVKLRQRRENSEWAALYFHIHDPDLFRHEAWQGALQSSYRHGPYTFRLESTYTRAAFIGNTLIGNFAYRPTQRYGGSAGAYGLWWNSRSDFNHDRELAAFVALERSFGDLGQPGLQAGVSLAGGYAPATVPDADKLREYALSVFASRTLAPETLKGARLSLHATRYVNKTRAPNWGPPYTNLFQDEHDLKLILSLPFSLK